MLKNIIHEIVKNERCIVVAKCCVCAHTYRVDQKSKPLSKGQKIVLTPSD